MSFGLALAVEHVGLVRGGRTLFEGLSFSAPPGSFLEIVGPNGAGKTSLLRAIAGFLRPAAGAILANEAGAALDPETRMTRLHFLGHRDGLKPALSVRAHLAYWAEALAGEGAGRPLDQALGAVGLGAHAELPARVLSAGQGRRLALARLIAAPRPLWLLDEPAAALDTAGKALLVDLVGAHCAQGGVALAAVHEPLGLAPTARIQVSP
jgi:heme exporter protein A